MIGKDSKMSGYLVLVGELTWLSLTGFVLIPLLLLYLLPVGT
jgi:hypothetical protein